MSRRKAALVLAVIVVAFVLLFMVPAKYVEGGAVIALAVIVPAAVLGVIGLAGYAAWRLIRPRKTRPKT